MSFFASIFAKCFLWLTLYWREVLIAIFTCILFCQLVCQTLKIIHTTTVNEQRQPRLVNRDQIDSNQPTQSPIKLPPFWPSNPIGFFNTCEALFEASQVQNEVKRYNALLDCLTRSPDILKRVYDILPTLDRQQPYTALKTQLIQRFSRTGEQCLSGLLSGCRRGNLTVCDYLSELRTTLGSHYGSSTLHDDLLRHCILSSVDTTTQKLLNLNDKMTLDELARQADKLIETVQHSSEQQSHNTNSNKPPQHLINEMLDSRISALQNSLSQTPTGPSRYHQTPSQSAQSTPRWQYSSFGSNSPLARPTPEPCSANSPSSQGLCYYHSRFGNRAVKCQGSPCPLSSVSNNRNLGN